MPANPWCLIYGRRGCFKAWNGVLRIILQYLSRTGNCCMLFVRATFVLLPFYKKNISPLQSSTATKSDRKNPCRFLLSGENLSNCRPDCLNIWLAWQFYVCNSPLTSNLNYLTWLFASHLQSRRDLSTIRFSLWASVHQKSSYRKRHTLVVRGFFILT